MLLSSIPVLLLFLSTGLQAANRISDQNPHSTLKRKASEMEVPVQSPFEEVRNDILGLRKDRPVPIADVLNIFPAEVWANILKFSVHTGQNYFDKLVICKTFFAILQNNSNEILDGVISDEDSLLKAIWYSDLRFSRTMASMLRDEFERRKFTPGYGEDWLASRAHASFLHQILNRIDDLQVLSDFYGKKGQSSMLFSKLRDDNGLAFDRSNEEFHYEHFYLVPPENHEKLLDLVDPKLLVATTSKCMQEQFQSYYIPALLADYIIPSYFDKSILSEKDLKTIRVVLKNSSGLFFTYFRNLLWACYFLTDDTILLEIATHLEHLGFNWNELFPEFPTKVIYTDRAFDFQMKAVLQVAQQWGLDIKDIAGNTASWYVPSAAIVQDELPDYLLQTGPTNCMDIINVLHHDRDGFLRSDPKLPYRYLFPTDYGIETLLTTVETHSVVGPKNTVQDPNASVQPPRKRQRTGDLQMEGLRSTPFPVERMHMDQFISQPQQLLQFNQSSQPFSPLPQQNNLQAPQFNLDFIQLTQYPGLQQLHHFLQQQFNMHQHLFNYHPQPFDFLAFPAQDHALRHPDSDPAVPPQNPDKNDKK